MSEAGSRSARRELDRVGAFSDGVFAVAITLLVLNIEVPAKPNSGISDEHFLEDTLPDLLNLLQGYFIAFAVIGLFWYGHHVAWSRLERSSGKLVATNMLLLSLIGLMPFTTALLGDFEAPLGVSVYALNVGLAALVDSLMDRIVISGRLSEPGDPRRQRETLIVGWLRPAVFFLSIPIAWISIPLAELFWFALFAVHPLARRLA
jgi:uncharacterized membrane protein